MNDIVILVLKNGKVQLSTNEIGFNGENKARNIVIELEQFIEECTAVLEINQHNKKYFLTLEEIENKFVLPIHESLLAYSEIEMQFRLVKNENIIIKSEIFKFKIEDSINAINKTIPEEYSDWFIEINNKLTELEKNSATKEEIADFIKKDVTGLQNYYDKTEIDSKTENFVTKTVNNLTNYYLKTETYNQNEINQKINVVKTGGFKSVDQLPEIGEENIIYLVPAKTTFSQNVKDEYIWLNDEQAFELIGSTEINLDSYVTTESLNKKLQDYTTSIEVDNKVDEETRDLLKTLSRELKPDEENGGFSAQTIVNVKNKSGATEMIMEIDNLDITTDVPTNSVLGTLKGQDLEKRLKAVEDDYVKNEQLPKIGTLSTVDEDTLQTNSSESLSGNIKLHKIAKTGSWADMNNKPNLPKNFTDLQNDWLMPATDEQQAISLSTQSPNKFFYTTEAE